MSFNISGVARVYIGFGIAATHQLNLGLAIGRGYRWCLAILVRSRLADDCPDWVAIPDCSFERLNDERRCAFASAVS